MTRTLESGRLEPLSGQAGSIIVFLHGYGANGADLLSIGNLLGIELPDTLFLAPDAPELTAGVPGGRQWFSIPWLDGSSQEESERGLLAAAEDLDAYLDAVIAQEGVPAERIVLFGFSQGTMMALHVAPRREDPVAGIAAFSGRLLLPDLLAGEAKSRPPVLLLHGDVDEVVPPQSLPEAANALKAAGWGKVYAHVMKGGGHGISNDGLAAAFTFIRERLGL